MNGLLLAFSYPNNLAEQILFLLIIPTIAAALLASVVLMINLFARKWLTAGQMGLLWGLVLLRLAMPLGLGPESYFSLQNLFFSLVQETAPVDIPVEAPIESWRSIGYHSKDAAIQNVSNAVVFKTPPVTELEFSFTETLLQYLTFMFELFLQVLPPIWFTGAVLIFGRMLVTHWRFTRKVTKALASTDDRLLQLWKICCQQVYVRRKIPIIVFDEISQPSVMGVIHPKLLLPSDVKHLKNDQLRLIMLHELAHITRWDLCVNWILFGLRLFHWWNPIYWLAATRFHSLREQSRDAMVLRWQERQADQSNNRDYCHEYSELLLNLAQRPSTRSRWRVSMPVSILGFLSSPFRKRSLANRLKALRSATVKVHPLQKTVVITSMAICAATGLADIKDPPVQDQSVQDPWVPNSRTSRWFSSEIVQNQPATTEFAPLIEQLFDVTAPLKNIINEEKITESQARQWILSIVETRLGLLKSSRHYTSGPLSEESKPEAHYREGNQLLVLAPAAFHKDFGILLDAWATSGISQIVFEARLAAVSTDITPIAGIEWSNLEGYVAPKFDTKFESLPDSKEPIVQASASVEEYFPVRIALLTEEQEFQLIKKAQSDERSNMTFCPKFTSFNGQKAMVTNLLYRPYVIGVEQQENKQLKAKIKVIEEGVSLKIRPILSMDRSVVHLNGVIQLSKIVDVNFLTTKIAGKEATIQIPRVHRRRISIASNLKDQQCLLVCIPPTFQEKRFQYLMIKVRIIDTTNLPQKGSK